MPNRKVIAAVPMLAGPAGKPHVERLQAAGFEVVPNQQKQPFNEDQLLEVIGDAFATIASTEPYNERVFEQAKALKVVARMGVGYDAVDVAAATRHGVAVAMAFGTNHESVADHAFALMADLSRQVTAMHQDVKAGGWRRYPSISLWRTTVGIVGLGRIGRALAKRCRGFDMRILGYDVAADAEYAKQNGIELVSLDTLLEEADFVSLHTPQTDETTRMIGAPQLAKMKSTAFLINTARGGVIDEPALQQALADKTIAGAGLDVFHQEPPENSPLLELDNVVLSPHIAGISHSALDMMVGRCIDSIVEIGEGRDPGEGYVINPEVFSS